jgi:hypothetical protein
MMKRLQVSMLPCMLAIVLATLLVGERAAAAALTCGTWSFVASPSIASTDAFLYGVAAISSKNVWAVGSLSGSRSPLIEQWNGQQWSIVPSPYGGTGSTLNAITTVPRRAQLWAVGYSLEATSTQTFVEFWQGTRWSITPSPNVDSAFNSLNGVAAVSDDDVWAVGSYYYNGSPTQTLIEHWNGKKWKIIKSPNPGSYNDLYGVAAISEDNVWAVGDYQGSSGDLSLIEHWDGHNWSIVPSPSPGAGFNALPSVAALATNNVWAGGYYSNGEVPILAVIEHWDGTSWSVVPSPNPSSAADYLTAVTRVPHTSQLWAVGFYGVGQYNQPLTEFYC